MFYDQATEEAKKKYPKENIILDAIFQGEFM